MLRLWRAKSTLSSSSPTLPAYQFLWNIHASVRALIPLHRLLLRKKESNWGVMVTAFQYSNLKSHYFKLFCDSIWSYYYWQTYLIFFFYNYWQVYSTAARQCWSERKSTVISTCDAQCIPNQGEKANLFREIPWGLGYCFGRKHSNSFWKGKESFILTFLNCLLFNASVCAISLINFL